MIHSFHTTQPENPRKRYLICAVKHCDKTWAFIPWECSIISKGKIFIETQNIKTQNVDLTYF